jgi:hypothetical protein
VSVGADYDVSFDPPRPAALALAIPPRGPDRSEKEWQILDAECEERGLSELVKLIRYSRRLAYASDGAAPQIKSLENANWLVEHDLRLDCSRSIEGTWFRYVLFGGSGVYAILPVDSWDLAVQSFATLKSNLAVLRSFFDESVPVKGVFYSPYVHARARPWAGEGDWKVASMISMIGGPVHLREWLLEQRGKGLSKEELGLLRAD